MSDVLHHYGLIRASKRTGKVNKSMTALGKGMLELWGLQNTGKNHVSVILDLDRREPVMEIIGVPDDRFPRVNKEYENFEYNIPREAYDMLKEGIEDA